MSRARCGAQTLLRRTGTHAPHKINSRRDSGRRPPRRHGRACPGHPRASSQLLPARTWMPGTSPGMTDSSFRTALGQWPTWLTNSQN